jgi:hypothetical protein
MEEIQYPVGRWIMPSEITEAELKILLEECVSLSYDYKNLTGHLTDSELAKTYREGGWDIRTIIHHMADTHQWHYIRLMQALTEYEPAGYMGNATSWGNIEQYKNMDIEASLDLLINIHIRYTKVFSQLFGTELKRGYFHTGRQVFVYLPQALHMIVWHLKHHLAHINLALK